MTETSWPFHDGDTGTPVLEDQWSWMARQWSATGVVGAPGDANLQPFGNSSGREVHVRAGRACVRGHWFDLDAQTDLAIAANTSGNPRIDRVVVRLDPSADEAVLAVLPGTPAGSPTAPTLTQTDTGVWELPLAQVTVTNGASIITAGNVEDERTFASVPVTPATSAYRPTDPVVGQRIYETDTGLDLVWNGSAWVTPDLDRVVGGYTSIPAGATKQQTLPTSPTGNWAVTANCAQNAHVIVNVVSSTRVDLSVSEYLIADVWYTAVAY